MEVWTEKYRPKNTSELEGGDGLVRTLKTFLQGAFAEIESVKKENRKIRAYNKTVPKNKRKKQKNPNTKKVAIILRGKHGVGKTTTVLALAKDMNIPVSESNASDARTIAKIRDLVAPATQCRDVTSYFTGKPANANKKIILVDEVDGISGKVERGGVSEILKVIKSTSSPIVLLENEWKQNLKPIYDACQSYEVKPASDVAIIKLLNKIVVLENISISQDEIKTLAKKSQGDYRAAINDLQFTSPSERDQLQSLFEAVRNFFEATYPDESETVLRTIPIQMQDFYLWIFENLSDGTSTNRLPIVYRSIADADIVLGHIMELMEWSMYPQFLEIIRVISTLTKTISGRINQPRWFTKKKASIEELMNDHNISREEATTLEILLSQLGIK